MGKRCSVDSQFDKLQGHSFAVIIQCGGNDIDLVPCGELLFHIKFTIANLSSMLPGISLVWSSILPKMKWRYSENIRNMEITRKSVNTGVCSYLLKIGGYVLRHPDFDSKHTALLKRSVCICRLLPKTFSQPNTRCSRNIFEIPSLFGLSF